MAFKDFEKAKQYSKEHYIAHKEEYKKRSKKWKADNRERHIHNSTLWNVNNPEKRGAIAHKNLLKKYDLTPEDYESILNIQGGVCKICNRAPNKAKRVKRLVVDHDHKTNKIRGLLCVGCNFRLGWYEIYRESIHKYLNILDIVEFQAK